MGRQHSTVWSDSTRWQVTFSPSRSNRQNVSKHGEVALRTRVLGFQMRRRHLHPANPRTPHRPPNPARHPAPQGLGKVLHSSCWLGVLSGLGDELEWSHRVSGVVFEGCGDADSSGQAMEADRGVAQRGHHGGAVPGVELVTVLVEGHIPDPVQPVLDTPMTLDEIGEVNGAGLAGIEGGDQVDHLHGLAAVDGASTAQLCDLTGTRPVDPVRDLTDLDRAPHAPP